MSKKFLTMILQGRNNTGGGIWRMGNTIVCENVYPDAVSDFSVYELAGPRKLGRLLGDELSLNDAQAIAKRDWEGR